MIFGECPYEDCDESFTTFMADNAPVFEKIRCEKCGRYFMEYHSRLGPEGYTMEDFNKEFEIDEGKKTIKRRAPQEKNVEASEQQTTPEVQNAEDSTSHVQ